MTAEQIGTELEVRRPDIPAVVLDGEIIELATAPTRDLARWLEYVREGEQSLREQKRAVSIEVHRRMDERAHWTMEDEGWVVSGQSPGGVSYNAERLYELLGELVEEGILAPAAMEAAVERKYAYSAKPAGINRLKKLGGAVAVAVEKAAVPKDPDTRSLKVTQKTAVMD